MTDEPVQLDPKLQVQEAGKAFEQEFERFARFTGAGVPEASLGLHEAESEQRALADLRTRHFGKKSALAASKKAIGRVAAEERAAFVQFVQQTEADLLQKLELAEQRVNQLVQEARTGRESIDVTLPGRRPRRGHLHPITLLRERIEDIFVSLGYVIE